MSKGSGIVRLRYGTPKNTMQKFFVVAPALAGSDIGLWFSISPSVFLFTIYIYPGF